MSVGGDLGDLDEGLLLRSIALNRLIEDRLFTTVCSRTLKWRYPANANR